MIIEGLGDGIGGDTRKSGGGNLGEPAELALTMATLGQIGLCIALLAARPGRAGFEAPLGLFFVACGVVVAGPAVRAFAPAWQVHALAMTLPAYLAMAPAIWLYVEGLTSETPWRLQAHHAWHFAPAGAGLLAVGLIAMLPLDVRDTMFIKGDLVDRPFPAAVVLFVFLLILVWIVQSGYYVVRIFRRLTRYRRRLKDLFASTEERELRWIGWLLIVVGGVWLAAFATIVSENFIGPILFSKAAGAGMALALVWTLALWGLRQRPGLEEVVSDPLPAAAPNPEPARKYERSALGDEQAQRIAAKIEAAMKHESLYLDPAISLQKLARHLAISPNHISQTLNEKIGQSFYDYVNSWRINAAKLRLCAGQETVLATALAVGFNSRSSFYKAFKAQTGQTPIEYAQSSRPVSGT